MTHFDQQLGLIISSSVSSHLLRAHNKNKALPPLECPGNCTGCDCDNDLDDPDETPDQIAHMEPLRNHNVEPTTSGPAQAVPIHAREIAYPPPSTSSNNIKFNSFLNTKNGMLRQQQEY